MHPRDLGPYALQMQRLIVLIAVLAAVSISIVSGPQLIPTWSSPTDVAQWLVYSPNLIVPTCAGMCALAATITTVRRRRYTPTPADTGWFLLTRLYLVCYLALMIACALLPAVNLSSPVPPVYFEAIVSDTNPILALYPLASFSCVAVLRGRDTAAYLAAIAPLQVLAMMAADPSIKLSDAVMGPIYFLLVAMVNAGMLHWMLTIACGLDRTQRSAREAERALAVERARGHARARSNGLIHDYVLAALILAITRGVDEAEVRAAADAALSALVPAPPSDGTVDSVQVRGALEALVGPRRPHWTFECRLPKDGWKIPTQVASALAGATHEALNNVRLHAGVDTSDPSAPARCRVTLTAGGDFVLVTIIDAGRGFDATRLSEGRHGVRDSIVKRMESVGGRATLTSRPGGGTRVILEWIDPHKRWLRPREAIRTALTRRQRGAGVGAKDQSRIAWDSQVRAAAESRGARALVLAGIAVHAYILTVEISHGAYTHVAPPVLALALIAVAGASLVARWADRVPPAVVTWGSAAAIGAANLLVLPLVGGGVAVARVVRVVGWRLHVPG